MNRYHVVALLTVTVLTVAIRNPSQAKYVLNALHAILSAPEKVGRPTITQDNSETKITVEIPDETKGLISCLFVVIVSNMTLSNESDSSLSKNKHQNVTEFSNTSLIGEYVAIAIPPSRFAGKKSVRFTLGDSSISHCNISNTDIGEKKTLRPDDKTDWIGENRPLRRDIQHRVYVSAVVPYRGGFAWKRSGKEIITWDQYETELTTTTKDSLKELSTKTVANIVKAGNDSFHFDPRSFGIALAIPAMLIIGFVAWKIFKNHRSKNLGKVAQPTEKSTTADDGYEDINADASSKTGTGTYQKDAYEETGYSDNQYAEISNGHRSASALQSSAYESYQC